MSQRVISVRHTVKQRANGHCEICGIKLQRPKGRNIGSMHHRFKKEYGGVDSLPNLLYLCITCHRHIHEDELSSSTVWGYLADYPEITPCYLPQVGWVLLTDEGYQRIRADEARKILEAMEILAKYRHEQQLLTLERQRAKMREIMAKEHGPKKEKYHRVVILSTLCE